MGHAVSILDKAKNGRLSFGERAESLAVDHLQREGFRIVMTNFTVPVGRDRRGAQKTAEVDIIALEGSTLCFIEVKARRNIDFAPATANIDLRKRRQIIRAARAFRRIFDIRGIRTRYDAVAIVWPDCGNPAIEHLRSYWDEGAFRKKIWHDGF